MAAQEASQRFLGNVDEAAIEQLENIGKGRPVIAILGHEKMCRFVQHQKPIKKSPLDGDTVVCYIGEASDARVIEAADKGEFGRYAATSDEDVAQHRRRRVVLHQPVPAWKRGEQIVIKTTDGRAKIGERVTKSLRDRDRFVQAAPRGVTERRQGAALSWNAGR